MTREELIRATMLAISTPIARGFVIARIKVVVPPDKLIYTDGETLDLSGIEVHAYYADGSDYGIIPLRDLTAEPNQAAWDGSWVIPETIRSGNYTITSYISPVETLNLLMELPGVRAMTNLEQVTEILRGYDCPCCAEAFARNVVVEGWSPLTIYLFTGRGVGDTVRLGDRISCVRIFTFGVGSAGQPIRITNTSVNNERGELYVGSYEQSNYKHLSSLSVEPAATEQEITIQWERPGDGRILTDTIDISVIR